MLERLAFAASLIFSLIVLVLLVAGRPGRGSGLPIDTSSPPAAPAPALKAPL